MGINSLGGLRKLTTSCSSRYDLLPPGRSSYGFSSHGDKPSSRTARGAALRRRGCQPRRNLGRAARQRGRAEGSRPPNPNLKACGWIRRGRVEGERTVCPISCVAILSSIGVP
ncbi:hypothetical protein GW17_00010965 [Ensete ventricosum]|uniref:Uncharacterized protein n=1 Tax=Ensete ventricosum TaxID=4639 RepID=A0A427AI49_ENSVE|nr:hypothetical protein B296_00005464 [Ensete ventricosum]RWW24740.1 hypothetical protein GW17_00010965 [Ensete ventricosum]